MFASYIIYGARSSLRRVLWCVICTVLYYTYHWYHVTEAAARDIWRQTHPLIVYNTETIIGKQTTRLTYTPQIHWSIGR